MIAKSLSTSQRYARLHSVAGRRAEFCQAMYPLLVAHADDFGRLAGDVFTVKHAIVPTSPRGEKDVAEALDALDKVNLIAWYEVDGRKCIQIQDFDAYQQGLHKRTKSIFPEVSGIFREIPSEEKRIEQKGREEKRDRATMRAEFDRFWAVYPRKVGKEGAWKVWDKLAPNAELIATMIDAARRQTPQWTDPKYIPHPQTWLNQGRWQDEVTPSSPLSQSRPAWICPHAVACSNREMCRIATELGRSERKESA